VAIREWQAFIDTHAAVLGRSPAKEPVSDATISEVESRLGCRLPPSYRTFLQCSDGYHQLARYLPDLRNIESVSWITETNPDLLKPFDAAAHVHASMPMLEVDYFNYAAGDEVHFDEWHFRNTLSISVKRDCLVLLLNPMVVWGDGEWEAWMFQGFGATRYRSFAEWMRHTLLVDQNDIFEHADSGGELPTVYLDPPSSAHRRIRPREEFPPLGVILQNLRAGPRDESLKAILQLSHVGGQEAIDALIETLTTHSEEKVRAYAAGALGHLGATEAIDALIHAIEKDDYEVATTAVASLGGIRHRRSAEFLLQLQERRLEYWRDAVFPLAELGEYRAIPAILKVLHSTEKRDYHPQQMASTEIAMFQEPGFAALAPLMKQQDRKIRSLALPGLCDLATHAKTKALREKACQFLRACLETETDPDLLSSIRITLDLTTPQGCD